MIYWSVLWERTFLDEGLCVSVGTLANDLTILSSSIIPIPWQFSRAPPSQRGPAHSRCHVRHLILTRYSHLLLSSTIFELSSSPQLPRDSDLPPMLSPSRKAHTSGCIRKGWSLSSHPLFRWGLRTCHLPLSCLSQDTPKPTDKPSVPILLALQTSSCPQPLLCCSPNREGPWMLLIGSPAYCFEEGIRRALDTHWTTWWLGKAEVWGGKWWGKNTFEKTRIRKLWSILDGGRNCLGAAWTKGWVVQEEDIQKQT